MVQNILQHQRHEPELGTVYILFTVIFLLLVGIYMTLKAVRNSIVNFLCKETIQNACLELFPKPLDPNLPLPPTTSKSLLKIKKKQLSNPLEPNIPLHGLEAL